MFIQQQEEQNETFHIVPGTHYKRHDVDKVIRLFCINTILTV